MKTVLVVGASGFIGRATAKALSDAGYRVKAGVRRPRSGLRGEEVQCEVQVDVTDPEAVDRSVEGCDLVVNCAGCYRWWTHRKQEYMESNVVGAELVARACLRWGARLVHISTIMSFGFPKHMPFHEDSPPGPHAAEYTRTKHLGDAAVWRLRDQGLRVTMLYLACVTGPGDTLAVGRPARVYLDFMMGKIPLLVGPDTRYIYVALKDVTAAICIVCERDRDPDVLGKFLIGNKHDQMTTRGYFQLMAQVSGTGKRCPSASLPLSVAFVLAWILTFIASLTGVEPVMPVDVIRTAKWGSLDFDVSKSERVLGLKYTPVRDAVVESIVDVKARPEYAHIDRGKKINRGRM